MSEEQKQLSECKGFVPRKGWSACSGENCDHSSHKGHYEKCRFCEGTGEIFIKYSMKDWVKELAFKGFTYREIMEITGIKSTNTIAYYLKK